MPLKLDVKKKFSAISDRVKSVEIHPTEPWILAALFDGHVNIWNYATQALKVIEVGDYPIRNAKFIVRKQWIICGSDDMFLRVYNYNTTEKLKFWEAHQDYIRCIVVHPSRPFVLTSSDDMTIKLWDWEKGWANTMIFEGHCHYVMEVVFNPKDANMFASASLDRTVKVWGLGSSSAYFTLEGHDKGVNCVDYFQGADRPYIASGADDRTIRIWDYQNKTCVAVLEGHTHNISDIRFHPSLPIILSAGEDNTVRIWHTTTYKLEKTLNYRMERAWAISCHKGSNKIAVGYDEGVALIKLGSEEPPVSMDSSQKVIWAKHNEIKTVNLKGAAELEEDGEKLGVVPKDLGTCEIYPQTLSHDPKGRFVAVCGDGEFIIYTALKWRSRAYGSGLEVVWGPGKGEYGVRDPTSRIKIFTNFKEKLSVRPDFNVEAIFGGALLGLRSSSSITFYDWENGTFIRKIDVSPRDVYWAESGDYVVLACDDAFYVLKYDKEAVSTALALGEVDEEEGVEGAFEVSQRFDERLRTGCWAGDCFLYTNSGNRLSYCIGAEVVTVAHTERPMYLLGYSPRHNRVFLMDKSHNIISYKLHESVINYQTLILRGDLEGARGLLDTIPNEYRSRIAQFLESQDLKEEALEVATDPDHKFEIAIQLNKLRVAYELAKSDNSPQKWHQLSELAFAASQFGLVEECLWKGEDLSGLLLLYSSVGNAGGMEKLAGLAKQKGKNNIAFMCLLLLQRLSDCVDLLIETKRIPEAAFFARTYAPSHVSRVVALWKEDLQSVNSKTAESLADPMDYMNLFQDFDWSLKAEELINGKRKPLPPQAYAAACAFLERDVASELKEGIIPRTLYDGPGGSVVSAPRVVEQQKIDFDEDEDELLEEDEPLKEEESKEELKQEKQEAEEDNEDNEDNEDLLLEEETTPSPSPVKEEKKEEKAEEKSEEPKKAEAEDDLDSDGDFDDLLDGDGDDLEDDGKDLDIDDDDDDEWLDGDDD
eukprot:CAMPEP_0201507694 /NCGR_PEP_ID=MMETSP0161_2-20130828/1285_1 /ASSEMBLY_ACC=CAM_ASM_000251 /TAXON_ID=180227 /ORGANISM="Neoparamoeba aestuarina, Strain SoJaBio B1-5/56/2" /LENGTH=988 /DNA_ID=CAMNT_0047902129 /DNA_START=135 /DNA_END=3101 /DNA_ORIENTATION=-